jgi:hypothetical protein
MLPQSSPAVSVTSLRHVQRHATRMVTSGHPASTKPPAMTMPVSSVEPESLAVQKVSRNTAVPEIAFAVLKNWCSGSSAACWLLARAARYYPTHSGP